MRRPLVAVVVALGALVFAGSAQACSCANRSPGALLRGADAAVTGKLLEVVPRDEYRSDYRYMVQAVYKNGPGLQRGRMIAVSSSSSGKACGLPQAIDGRIGLLLTEDREGGWRGSLCAALEPRLLRDAAAGSGTQKRSGAALGFGHDCAS